MTCLDCIHHTVCKHADFLLLDSHFPFVGDRAIKPYMEGIAEVKANACVQYLSVDNLIDQLKVGFVLGRKI